jgi:hypothetical protein
MAVSRWIISREPGLPSEDSRLRVAVLWYRVIGWGVFISLLMLRLLGDGLDLIVMLAVAVTWLVAVCGSVLVSVAAIDRPRFMVPAVLFALSGILPWVSSLIPVPAGSVPGDLSRALGTSGMACYFLGGLVALVVGWGTPMPPRD